jgi:uncharacterized membrane protein (DUF4010 family)
VIPWILVFILFIGFPLFKLGSGYTYKIMIRNVYSMIDLVLLVTLYGIVIVKKW